MRSHCSPRNGSGNCRGGASSTMESRLRDDLELLKGAIDIHVHHGPDLYPRIQDPVELAQSAKAAGFRAVCIKTHNFPTVQLALLTSKLVPDIDVLGSLACNFQVGGVNPMAVE